MALKELSVFWETAYSVTMLAFFLERRKGWILGVPFYEKVKVLVAQSCPILCDPTDCSPPGSSVHEILQARIVEWVAISFSRDSSQLKDQTWVSHTTGRFFTI